MAEGDRRTFSTYKAQVLHMLGNPDSADMSISAGDMVNDALEHIAAMHEWQWLSTAQQSLDITADQDYVELPADFGSIVALEYGNSWTNRMIPTTWETILALRQIPIASWTGGYYYVIGTGNVELGSEDAGLSLPTINLYPTPAESVVGAISMVYRRFLRRMTDDTDRPQWPAYMDRPLSLLSRAFASTDYDDDPSSAYTTEFRAMIVDCINKDGLSIKSFGIPNSAVYGPQRLTPWGYPDSGIPDPTIV